MSLRVASLALLALTGCSFVLDFDDVDGLPCPCDPDHVCLIGSDRCVPRGSVDLFKSCSTDTANDGDDLCPQNAICQAVNGQGTRCLPKCEPSNYATPEAGQALSARCPFGYTCWDTDRGGVCSEGICRDLPNNCVAPGQCVTFNGAGVCFTPCDIFQTNPLPCGGDQLCHPIGSTNVTACIQQGTRARSDPCDHENMCRTLDEINRPMACGRPEGAPMQIRRCFPICIPGAPGQCQPGESCIVIQSEIDPINHLSLGLCMI